ncbi:hypothetical protein CWATWH0402_5058 [Crocosphaera watsonii WH 0402]|uniref:Uncharacterized protein n=1 Tax=Crocosphaera watsonii WH 0402 TaxID=1284629 RepID=T2JJT9_CROWT|nr:hypothetical protein CWATWH0402_5058 [Crocosphaera watsonii WH 0402]
MGGVGSQSIFNKCFFNIKMDVSFWVYFRCLKVPVIVSAGKLNH